MTFAHAAKEQRDLLGNWAYQAFSKAWTTRPPSSIQIDYEAGRPVTLDGGPDRSGWHLAYVVAVLHGVFSMRAQKLPEGARIWALGEVRGDTFVEVGQHELLDKARIVGGTGAPGTKRYLLVHQGDGVWAAQREFLRVLSEMGRVPDDLLEVTVLRFRDLATLRDPPRARELRRLGPSDRCARREEAPPAVAPQARPAATESTTTRVAKPGGTPGSRALPSENGRRRAVAVVLGVAGTAALAALGGVLLARRPEPPPPPAAASTPANPETPKPPAQPVTVAAAAEPPPEPTRPREASRARLPKPEIAPLPPPPAKVAPPSLADAGAEQAEEARVKQARTNLGASLDTVEHRRVQATPVE